MKSFEEVWAFTDKIPGSFSQVSAEKLYALALSVPNSAMIAELGVNEGRSLSLMLQGTVGRHPSFLLVDTWGSVPPENRFKAEGLVKAFAVNYLLMQMKSTEAAKAFDKPLDLIHIDAYHFDNIPDGGPSLDCEMWLPKVKPGGVACFHDYNSCFPDVNIAVDKFTAGWEDLGVWDGLAIRRKP
jgi:hypothetical protein